MNKINEHTTITIKGSDLVSAYGVYIVLVKNDKSTYCYVGQTGDAKYISPRSPFYRIAAHLSYRTSTQNQVYEGLKRVLNIETKQAMEQWLADKELKIHFFKTDDFEFMVDTVANKETHTYKRRRTLALETALLNLLSEKDLVLLNKNQTTYKDYKAALPVAKNILKQLDL